MEISKNRPLRALSVPEVYQLQFPQLLQAVAFAVNLGFEGEVSEFRSGLNVEQEQQPVHVAQALSREGVCEVFAVDAFPGDGAQVAHGLVAQKLNSLAQGILEVLGYGMGVFVGTVR